MPKLNTKERNKRDLDEFFAIIKFREIKRRICDCPKWHIVEVDYECENGL